MTLSNGSAKNKCAFSKMCLRYVDLPLLVGAVNRLMQFLGKGRKICGSQSLAGDAHILQLSHLLTERFNLYQKLEIKNLFTIISQQLHSHFLVGLS